MLPVIQRWSETLAHGFAPSLATCSFGTRKAYFGASPSRCLVKRSKLLRNADLLDGLRGRLPAPSATSFAIDRPWAGQRCVGFSFGELAERLGRRLQAGVGPVVPVGRVRASTSCRGVASASPQNSSCVPSCLA